jgi:hypothetical protein
MDGSIDAFKIPGPESAELIYWLREQAVETHNKLRELEGVANADRAATITSLQKLEAELRAEIDNAIDTSEGAYRGWRLVGFILAIAGVTVTLIGSLIPT